MVRAFHASQGLSFFQVSNLYSWEQPATATNTLPCAIIYLQAGKLLPQM